MAYFLKKVNKHFITKGVEYTTRHASTYSCRDLEKEWRSFKMTAINTVVLVTTYFGSWKSAVVKENSPQSGGQKEEVL